MFDIETDVLIVGSGPAGGASAALLSSYGINEHHDREIWLACQHAPRSHHQPTGTMEVLRELGVEEEAKEKVGSRRN